MTDLVSKFRAFASGRNGSVRPTRGEKTSRRERFGAIVRAQKCPVSIVRGDSTDSQKWLFPPGFSTVIRNKNYGKWNRINPDASPGAMRRPDPKRARGKRARDVRRTKKSFADRKKKKTARTPIVVVVIFFLFFRVGVGKKTDKNIGIKKKNSVTPAVGASLIVGNRYARPRRPYVMRAIFYGLKTRMYSGA